MGQCDRARTHAHARPSLFASVRACMRANADCEIHTERYAKLNEFSQLFILFVCDARARAPAVRSCYIKIESNAYRCVCNCCWPIAVPTHRWTRCLASVIAVCVNVRSGRNRQSLVFARKSLCFSRSTTNRPIGTCIEHIDDRRSTISQMA